MTVPSPARVRNSWALPDKELLLSRNGGWVRECSACTSHSGSSNLGAQQNSETLGGRKAPRSRPFREMGIELEPRSGQRLASGVSLLTNLAVVVSIVFLAVEVRQTGNAVRGATYQQRAIQEEEWGKFLADSEFLRPAMTRYQLAASFDSLTADEQGRLQDVGLAAAKRLDGVFYQHSLELLDRDYFETAF